MSMTVCTFSFTHIYRADVKIIMHILCGSRGDFVQNFLDIRNQKRFGFLNENCHCRVEALNIDHTPFYPRFFEFRFNFVRDVDEIQCRRGFKLNQVVYDLHNLTIKY